MVSKINYNPNINNTQELQKKGTQKAGGQKDLTQQIVEQMMTSSAETLKQATGGNPIVSAVVTGLMGAMGIGQTNQTQAANGTQEVQGTQNNTEVNTKAIEQAKQDFATDLASLKNAGVTVSDWSDNNTCTLSWNGHNAEIVINDDGSSEMKGDIGAIMEHLKSSDSKEAESVEKQNKFLEQQKNSGDPVVGDPKMTSVKVNGQSVSVNEYTTESGKKLYLDGNGNQITPDAS